MKAIEAIGLTKRYQDKVAVDDLHLTIAQGELFALLGVNGAGKTTTVKMLSCLLMPSGGDALLLGESIKTNPYAVKHRLNLSPQETAIAPNLTVLENLELIAGIYGMERDVQRKKAAQMLDSFRLGDVAKAKARTLSGGMQRRLSIAMALITEPEILFLDEPTLGLDVLARRELWHVIQALKGKVTTLLTTHYMEEAEALSDRIGIMAQGRLKAVGTAAALKAQTGTATFEDAFIALAAGDAPLPYAFDQATPVEEKEENR